MSPGSCHILSIYLFFYLPSWRTSSPQRRRTGKRQMPPEWHQEATPQLYSAKLGTLSCNVGVSCHTNTLLLWLLVSSLYPGRTSISPVLIEESTHWMQTRFRSFGRRFDGHTVPTRRKMRGRRCENICKSYVKNTTLLRELPRMLGHTPPHFDFLRYESQRVLHYLPVSAALHLQPNADIADEWNIRAFLVNYADHKNAHTLYCNVLSRVHVLHTTCQNIAIILKLLAISYKVVLSKKLAKFWSK